MTIDGCCIKTVGRTARKKPKVLLVRAAKIRVDGMANGLGNARTPVRKQGLARLVVKRSLGPHLRVELLRHFARVVS